MKNTPLKFPECKKLNRRNYCCAQQLCKLHKCTDRHCKCVLNARTWK